jgi:NADPH-dependent ferric siderophore reductase
MSRVLYPDFRERVAEHQRSGVGAVRFAYPILVRSVPLVDREDLNPHMLRLTLRGDELAALHSYQADDHVKIVLPDQDGTLRAPVPNDRQMLDWPKPMPPGRDYTIRRHVDTTLVLDIVRHDGGLASEWLDALRLGDQVTVAGPPGGHAFRYTHDRYVLAVDATGLPAAARWLEEAPTDAPVHLVVETAHAEEHEYPLPERDRLEVVRLVRGDGSGLADAVAALDSPAGTFLFAAGEASDIRPLRRWSKELSSVTGYWKRGVEGFERD